ncbi:sensor domain-containing phosphodiesterase [Pseudooceanicola spongiae]|uniref:EAL domain-containing protein n=1 Tax=Pseudooceanicola spongiae TaxID=2613965 RepID=A0A7L9WJE2_9RHOB|nr:EAL domain-containing protein [Pseudooceanicola spongiae]QOL80495.1 EAL domain-containing protein [Pseudooceanicola spongiae]
MKDHTLPIQLDAQDEDILDIALKTMREHLGMDVAYLSEFVDGRAVFRAVSAPGLEDMIQPGQSIDIREVYCQHILDGNLPQVIKDTSQHPIATALPITRNMPIGSHVSVPVTREDGSVYGMFCCLSSTPNPTLNPRDLSVMETFANIASKGLNVTLGRRAERAARVSRVDQAIKENQIEVFLQPIFTLEPRALSSFEALSRFRSVPYRTPDLWFKDALSVGRQVELEMMVIRQALVHVPKLPNNVRLSVNASPETIASGLLTELLTTVRPDRLILEVTEHAIIENYSQLQVEVETLRSLGVRIAADDVGAGHSGLTQLLRMKPDVIKLDIELVRGIDQDSAKRSLVMGMTHFAADIGAKLVAEGIETEAELETLRQLKVHKGQGYLLGRPEAAASALARRLESI